MARTEPDASPGLWDVTTVSYLGDAQGGLIPVGPPSVSCETSGPAAVGAAEANRFAGVGKVAYANQYGVRPTAVGTYAQCLSGAPAPYCVGQPDGSGVVTFSSCGYSESQAQWVRIDSFTKVTKTGSANLLSNGGGTLYLGSGAPAALGAIDTNGDGVNDATTNPTSCSQTGTIFPFTSKTYSRDARTDHWAASVGACGTNAACITNVNLGIGQDPNGPSPKVKLVDQTNDTSDGLADDWDGDGCPDWDELDHQYMPGTMPLLFPPTYNWTTNPVNGMDPFNPEDCDPNYTATISLTTTIVHNTGGATTGQVAAACTVPGGTPPNCNYFGFRCLGTMADAKTGAQRALTYRLGCYADSPVTVVNSSYPAPMNACPVGCGDGKSDQPPAGCLPNAANATWCSSATAGPDGCAGGACGCPTLPCAAARYVYQDIDPAAYPVVDTGAANNYFDTTMNQIHLGGCFAGFGGGTFGNVYGSSTIDAHTGAGSFQIYLDQTLANCQAGTPVGTPVNGQVEIVVLKTEKGIPDAQKWDSDGDGCSDARELGSNQMQGGLRDPYDPFDYFNPDKNTPDQQTIADVLKTVQQFNKNQGNAAYTRGTDRTAVSGGPGWSLGAPDGQQTVADILAAVKQFSHNCPRVLP